MSRRVHFAARGAAKHSKTREDGQGKERVNRKSRKKPWDTTVSDLSVHKLTNDELERRRRSHQSKNIEVAKHDLYEKAKENFDLDDSGNLRSSSPLIVKGSGQKFAVLQQSLQGKELHELLAESDKALCIVKDMFGDDPKRHTCQPNVTVAPHIMSDRANLERTLMESKRDGPRPTAFASPGGIRDESVQKLVPNKPALNELPSPTELKFDESRDTTLTPEAPDPSTTPDTALTPEAPDTSTTPDTTLTPEAPDPSTTPDITLTLKAPDSSTTPQAKGYKSSIDLKRFQSLIQREELVASKNSDLSMNPQHRHNGELKPTARPHLPKALQQAVYKQESTVVKKTWPVMRDKSSENKASNAIAGSLSQHNDSVTGLSDISTITSTDEVNTGLLDNKGCENGTVNSGASALFNQDIVSQARPMLSAHPLYAAHKMTPVKREQTTQKIHSELQELEKLVRGLDRELRCSERTASHLSTPTATPTLTSDPGDCPPGAITLSMYTAVGRMTHYLQESEAQRKAEVEVREHLLQTMTEQQNLMDALTSDMVNLQKESVVLRKELVEAQHSTSEQLLAMQREISDIHKMLSHVGTPMWSAQPLPHEAIQPTTPLRYVQRQVQTREINSLPHISKIYPDYLDDLRSSQYPGQRYRSSSGKSSLSESSNASEVFTYTSADHSNIEYPGVLSTRAPTSIQTSSTRTPTTVQMLTTRVPTTVQTSSIRAPTTVQMSSTRAPTTVQVSSTRAPTTVQTSSTMTPITVQVSSTRAPTTVQVSSTRAPTTVQTSSTRTPTTVQALSTRTPTTVQALSTRMPTTVQALSTRTPTTVQTLVSTFSSARSPSGDPYIYAQQSPLHLNSSEVSPHTDTPPQARPVEASPVTAQPTVDKHVANLLPPHGSKSSFPYPQHPQSSLASPLLTLDNSDIGMFAPPPLTLALQVPAMEMPTPLTDTQMGSNRSQSNVTTLPSSMPKINSISSEQVPSSVEPVFNVTGLLNSLENISSGGVAREKTNYSQFTSEDSKKWSSLSEQRAMLHPTPPLVSAPPSTNTTSTFDPKTLHSAAHKGGTDVLTSKENSLRNQSGMLHSRQTFQAPDLSVSLLSLPTGPADSTPAASDVSMNCELENDRTGRQAARSDGSPSCSLAPQSTQDHSGIDSSLPTGWFSLTSHIAHH